MSPPRDATDTHPEPSRRLPPQARTLWRVRVAVRWAGVMIGAAIAATTLGDELPGLVATLLWVAPVAGLAVDLAASELRWRRWRFEVREEEIDLRRGAFTVTRTLVPTARVQHVDTHRGVLDRAFAVSTVVVHTAAGAISIPALLATDADAVRDRIATLSRSPDEL